MMSTGGQNFKNLPLFLYSFSSQNEKDSVLWLPPLGVHKITNAIDWLTGMQISNLSLREQKNWSPELSAHISKLDLPLDEHHPDFDDKTLIFSLPPGFKSILGIVKLDSKWEDAESVARDYKKVTPKFKSDVLIQSLNIWSRPTPQGQIEWIDI